MWLAKLPRKVRRAYDFGTAEQRKEIEAKYGPRKPFFVQEIDGRIEIPIIEGFSEMPWMMPYKDIPDIYECDPYSISQTTHATSPEEYRHLLSAWFHRGLSEFKPKLKVNVWVAGDTSPQVTSQLAFKRYVGIILQSREPSHEHKFAYLVYVCDVCCDHIDWWPKS